MRRVLTKEELTKPQGELQWAEIAYYWADLTGLLPGPMLISWLCAALPHTSLLSAVVCVAMGEVWPRAGRGPSIAVYLWLDQDPSCCRETHRRIRDLKSHVPLSPPSHSGALRYWWQLVDLYGGVMWRSSFAAFFCPHLLSPPPAWQHCSNWKDKQFYRSRKLDGDVKRLHFSL